MISKLLSLLGFLLMVSLPAVKVRSSRADSLCRHHTQVPVPYIPGSAIANPGLILQNVIPVVEAVPWRTTQQGSIKSSIDIDSIYFGAGQCCIATKIHDPTT
jgi:hypothetical protein